MTHETVSVSVQPVMRSRREFIKLSGMTALSVGGMMFLAGCGPAPQDAGEDSSASTDASGVQLGDGRTLRVGMEAAYAPYNWQVSEESEFTIPIENVSGAYADGYDVQVAKIIAAGLDMEPVAVKLEFGSLIDALNNGQIDIVCAGMSVTPEREAAAAFSDSYVDDDIVMICKNDSAYAGATTFADLADASILGQAATMYDDVIAQVEAANHMTPAETVPMVVENLRNGTCDIITYSMLSAPKLLEVYPDLVVLDMEEAFTGSVMPDNAAVSKDNAAALDKINEIIAGIDDEERQDMWSACMDRQPA
jgi:ABC-type amino acid transport substrate-binding protein